MHVACLTKDYDDPNRHDIRTHYMFQKFTGYAGQGNSTIVWKVEGAFQKFAGYAGQGNWTIVASKRPVSLFEQGTNVC